MSSTGFDNQRCAKRLVEWAIAAQRNPKSKPIK
jgi:hypothetical protein